MERGVFNLKGLPPYSIDKVALEKGRFSYQKKNEFTVCASVIAKTKKTIFQTKKAKINTKINEPVFYCRQVLGFGAINGGS